MLNKVMLFTTVYQISVTWGNVEAFYFWAVRAQCLNGVLHKPFNYAFYYMDP